MGKTISITMPDALYGALTRKGALLGPGDLLRQFAIMSAYGADVPLGLSGFMGPPEGGAKVEAPEGELALGGGNTQKAKTV